MMEIIGIDEKVVACSLSTFPVPAYASQRGSSKGCRLLARRKWVGVDLEIAGSLANVSLNRTMFQSLPLLM